MMNKPQQQYLHEQFFERLTGLGLSLNAEQRNAFSVLLGAVHKVQESNSQLVEVGRDINKQCKKLERENKRLTREADAYRAELFRLGCDPDLVRSVDEVAT